MAATGTAPALERKFAKGPGRTGLLIFGAVLATGLGYAAWHLISDLSAVRSTSFFPFVLLGVALLIALGFEFVNGFHDTANAVATVIYTHSLEPHVAVVWSGAWNFLGVLVSTGAVAFGIISPASGGVDSSGRKPCGICNGFRPPGGGHYLECGHV